MRQNAVVAVLAEEKDAPLAQRANSGLRDHLSAWRTQLEELKTLERPRSRSIARLWQREK